MNTKGGQQRSGAELSYEEYQRNQKREEVHEELDNFKACAKDTSIWRKGPNNVEARLEGSTVKLIIEHIYFPEGKFEESIEYGRDDVVSEIKNALGRWREIVKKTDAEEQDKAITDDRDKRIPSRKGFSCALPYP